jgi:glycosyltransferase involved in cell wall biosynthesis
VDLLMQQVDVTIIPSIWWENSPVVIQEAMRNRKPIICSDIGGMAEKVRDGVDGWHFPVGSALSLAALLKRLAANRQMIFEMSTGMQLPPTTERIVDDHVQLYRCLAEAVR